jgi:hypothetical protein
MVGVVVGLEDVADPNPVLEREREVVLDLPLGIDDDGLVAVSDEVRRATQIAVQDLTKDHGQTSLVKLC